MSQTKKGGISVGKGKGKDKTLLIISETSECTRTDEQALVVKTLLSVHILTAPTIPSTTRALSFWTEREGGLKAV